jgi:hypothetical protein
MSSPSPNPKLVIRTPTIEAEIKIVINILTAYGFSDENANLAIKNIKDKRSVDEALEWLFENDICAESYE